TGTPLSPCFKIARIWLSVNLDFFMSFSKRIKGRRSPIFNPMVFGDDYPNHRRLLEPIGNIPPAEAEEQYYATLDQEAVAV
ncbi:hypothetical protein, partial [Roseibium aquae]|uniref:hypothetical protein n=1 Tax=Roseibium aquae TaxID=1323746 RepID=UPI0035308830